MINKIKTVHLIGLGAVGATYASLIYKTDRTCIKVVIDEQRYNSYKQGTVINGERYNFDLIIPSKEEKKAELIIIAVKGHHLKEAIEIIRPLVGDNTVILSLLNGISSEEDISQAFGRSNVLHGFCVGIDAIRENTEIYFKNAGRIVFGEFFTEANGKSSWVAEFFSKAGIPYTIPKDIRREMWWKFMMNVGLNQTSAILRATYGVFMNNPDARYLMEAACREVLPIAEREGVHLCENDIQGFFDVIANITPESKTSMLQDIEAARKTEVESFSFTVIALAKKHGVAVPVNEILYRMIRALESINKVIP